MNKLYTAICESNTANIAFIYNEFNNSWKMINDYIGFGINEFPDKRDERPRIVRIRPTYTGNAVNRMNGQVTVHVHMVYCKLLYFFICVIYLIISIYLCNCIKK